VLEKNGLAVENEDGSRQSSVEAEEVKVVLLKKTEVA